jgi:hypothetical protein
MKLWEHRGGGQIEPVKFGLGKDIKKQNILLMGDASTLKYDNSNDKIIDGHYEEINITTLDTYITEHDELKIGLIKVDIEGFEQEFLAGARSTIHTQKPAMLISIYHNADDFFNIKTIIEGWNLGYKFKIRQGMHTFPVIETVLIAEVI